MLLAALLCTSLAPAEPATRFGAALGAGSTVVEPGAAVGPGLWWRTEPLDDSLLAIGARIELAWAERSNGLWDFTDYQGTLSLGAALQTTLGAGTAWVEAGGGALLLYDTHQRHQFRRLDAADVPGRKGTGWSLGPLVYGEAGVSVHVWNDFALTAAGGPTYTWQRLTSGAVEQLGFAARLGVGYAL
jgi:hypothetical protein